MSHPKIRRNGHQVKYYIKLAISTVDYMKSLGSVFESYLKQDSGNKCYSINTDDSPVWIKILNLETCPLANIYDIVEFYNDCKSDLIPKHWELVELMDHILMKHDWVPGKVLKSPDEDRNDKDSAFNKFMQLPLQKKLWVYDKILSFFVELEKKQIIMEDFYDGCIIYDFENDDVFLCDLDHIHRGPYELKRERQYGSRRFMAPEEFKKGSVIDCQTNVYTMGATAFVLLNNNKRELVDWGLSENLYRIFQKAISLKKSDRFRSVEDLCTKWKAAYKETAI